MSASPTTPLYQQIYDDLKDAIRDGVYAPGDKVPSESELSERYQVSRITVRRAIEDLCSEGILTKMQGRGTFVETRRLSSRLFRTNETISFTSLCAESDVTPGAHIVERQIVPSRPDELEFFSLEEGSLMVMVRRTRTADGLPVADETVIVPYSWGAPLLKENLEDASIFEAIERIHGASPAETVRWTVNAVRTTSAQASLLGLSAGDPMLYSETYYADRAGNPISVSRDYFVGGRYELSLA